MIEYFSSSLKKDKASLKYVGIWKTPMMDVLLFVCISGILAAFSGL